MRLVATVWLCAAGLAISVLALGACGGSQEGESVTRPNAESTLGRDELAAMIPTQAEFPSEINKFKIPESAGWGSFYTNNRLGSYETPDREDSGAELRRLGRTGGYTGRFETAEGAAAPLVWAEARVDAFRTDEQAERFLQQQFAELQAREGEEFGNSQFSVDRTFAPSDLPSSLALCYTVREPSDTEQGYEDIHICQVGFRIGRVDGWSAVARVDSVDPAVMALELAKTLRAKMDGVVTS